MLVRPENRPSNEATLDASWRIRDAYSAVYLAGYFARSGPRFVSFQSNSNVNMIQFNILHVEVALRRSIPSSHSFLMTFLPTL